MPSRVATPSRKVVLHPDVVDGDGVEKLFSSIGQWLVILFWVLCGVVLYLAMRVAQIDPDGRLMPSYEVPSKKQVLFILGFCLLVIGTIDWWVPLVWH